MKIHFASDQIRIDRRAFSQVRIVVPSSWGSSGSSDELRLHLSADIRERVVDITPRFKNLESVLGQRQRECEVRIRENSPDARWLTQDDLERYFDEGKYLTPIPRVDDGGAGLEMEYGQTLRTMIGAMLAMENLS